MMNLYSDTSLVTARRRDLLAEAEHDRLAAAAMAGKPTLYHHLLTRVGRVLRAPYARLVTPGQPVATARMTLSAHHQ
jgi:hypothetical protein